MSRFIVLLVIIAALGGWGKGKELENRDYVTSMAVEYDNGYVVSTAVAGIWSKNEDKKEVIFRGRGESIDKAVCDINNRTKGQLYMGLNKVIIIDSSIDDYENIADYFSSNIDIARDTAIVQADEPYYILKAENNGDSASEYIHSFFENKKMVDIDSFMDYYNKGEKIILPKAVNEEGNVVIKQ